MTHYDDDDAFENGVLRDGARHHVPIQMRDSLAPMITDGTERRSAGNRVGGLGARKETPDVPPAVK